MSKILKEDKGVLVTLENGSVRKTVRGQNHSRFSGNVFPKEMVDREIRALKILESVEGVQRFAGRESTETFYTKYMEGNSLKEFKRNLNNSYFDELAIIVRKCQERGVYRIGQAKLDFIVQPNGKPGIIDFGNILFYDDYYAKFPGTISASKFYNNLRVWDLRRRHTP